MEGYFEILNPNFSKLLGYTNEELQANQFLTFIHPDDIDATLKEVEKLKTGALTINFVNRYRKKDGSYLWFDWNATPNAVTGKLYAIARDITERKQAEESLRLSQFVIDNAGDTILWVGPDARIVNVNAAACSMLGYTREELLQFSIPDIDPNYNIEEWPNHFAELRQKGSMTLETMQRAKDGRLIPVEVIANYIKFGDQELNCAFVRNITDRKKIEQNLELQNKALQKTNDELDRFVYSVSHDLRSPLSSILGIINLAELENPAPAQAHYLDLMRQSINRQDRFIRDILNYSRNTRLEVKAEEINFGQLLEEAQTNLMFMEGSKRLQVKTEIENTVPFYSDLMRCDIVLENLLSNAIKYQDYGKDSGELLIRIATTAKNATISFHDNGMGIEQKHLNKIFNMFYRATSKTNGSGLGLYIAKECILKMKGAVHVESQSGIFTKFEIVIPNLINHEPTTRE